MSHRQEFKARVERSCHGATENWHGTGFLTASLVEGLKSWLEGEKPIEAIKVLRLLAIKVRRHSRVKIARSLGKEWTNQML
ncbi:predicted protein [Chaetomium globosum CBS 148.51]|uniref:Uncharacterized protein n=1 Tax=Chaetomium globosum (strain ATCC 6205 / CBS 148.51 / DSM 1962 / NBRC 6347 / NRRL 1970) TaxID=306901 RepID=Q2HCN7_CHAGB|nr:uncharacterized protein CHGG_02017 [Chaetomium globosum CBS 148.51]EAQ93782.1 predicted protein [Chaetomium globosum CBS 148.51]